LSKTEKKPEVHSLLRELGLTEYQRLVFSTLCNHGEGVTADIISNESGVPSPRVYQVLEEFDSEMNILDVDKSSRRKNYKLKPGSVVVENLKDSAMRPIQREIQTIDTASRSLLGALRYEHVKPYFDESSRLMWLIGESGADASKFAEARKRTSEMYSRAENDIVIMAGSFDWGDEVYDTLVGKLKDQELKIRLLLKDPKKDELKKAEKARALIGQLSTFKPKFSYRFYEPRNVRLSIVDEREAMLVIWNVRPSVKVSDEFKMSSSILYTSHAHLVAEFYTAFLHHWENSRQIDAAHDPQYGGTKGNHFAIKD
jgi:sugar-specific transcriptional regulator TrmB